MLCKAASPPKLYFECSAAASLNIVAHDFIPEGLSVFLRSVLVPQQSELVEEAGQIS